jgi:S1-C subfamily serine protease
MALGKAARRRIAKATVCLPRQEGQGVLVPGGYILTACHCITWSGEGGMAPGDHCLEDVRTADGRSFRASVCAAEPLADIAGLFAPDDQTFTLDYRAFEEFTESTPAIPLRTRAPKPWRSFRVHVLLHKGHWITATATHYGDPDEPPGGRVELTATDAIEGGTSGGPVVDDDGNLVGVVSFASDANPGEASSGAAPLAYFALPRWLSDGIAAAAAVVP